MAGCSPKEARHGAAIGRTDRSSGGQIGASVLVVSLQKLSAGQGFGEGFGGDSHPPTWVGAMPRVVAGQDLEKGAALAHLKPWRRKAGPR